jgi:uncharacterized protein with NRDE domain
MCTLLFSLNQQPGYRFVIAANRDEFFARRTQRAHAWEANGATIIGGRDLEAGGTWLGITRNGRFAAVTNYRDPADLDRTRRSRGALTLEFLTGTQTPEAYLASIANEAQAYNAFNLLVGDFSNGAPQLLYYSNRNHAQAGAVQLSPGVYGLSNHLLDTPWPKVVAGKQAFSEYLTRTPYPITDDLLQLLHNTREAPDDALPNTGVPLEWERRLSALHIASENYGTCVATVLTVAQNGAIHFAERAYNPNLPKGDVVAGLGLA